MKLRTGNQKGKSPKAKDNSLKRFEKLVASRLRKKERRHKLVVPEMKKELSLQRPWK